jgi:hypothetical protein
LKEKGKVKHITVFVIGLALAIFLLGANAMMQQDTTNLLRNGQQTATPNAHAYISDNSWHKLIIDANDQTTYNRLRSQNAIIGEINYGSFRLVVVNEQALGGKAAVQQLAAAVQDEFNLIPLNGYVLDTTSPDTTYHQLPADLRKTDLADALARGAKPAGGLYIIQFAGPIQDAWLEALKATGVEVVTYLPSNAYVVRGNAKAALALIGFAKQNQFAQFIGDYEPSFKLSPGMRAARENGGEIVDVTVQVIDGPGAKQTIANLSALAKEVVGSFQALNYHNLELRALAGRLAEMAGYDDVFAIAERGPRRRLDEAQGQIVAGNLSGNSPTGPGYLSWLASKGFTSSQFTFFIVNVVDDTYTLAGHTDLPSGRVGFQNNPTNQSGVLGGHGFLNAHIIGGFNNNTGSAFEDALGYNYGLGVAPFARVGVTAIFGNTASSGTAWENTAYGQGARISSNSWGYKTLIGGPMALYDANAQAYDAIVRDTKTSVGGLQQMAVVFAAGNDGSGANTVTSPATAKNVITVGASENVRSTGTDGCEVANAGANSANDLADFSSRGPVNSAGGDGRIKPDIVAPGTHIEAGVPQSNYDGSSVCDKYFPAGQTVYGWSSGTSHAAPAVAGGAALVYQDFLNKGLTAPSPAMIKAFLMNSAAYMNGVGAGDSLPSNGQGMGRMDLGRAFDGVARFLVDQTEVLGVTGETFQTTATVANADQPVRVTLAWTDAAGPTVGAPWVNNLDLEVTAGGVTYKGNVFSGANSISGGVADARNNVESIFLPAGLSGSITVTVKAANLAGNGVPGNADATDQDFALVVYNANAVAPVQPTIGVSPPNFNINASVGGANPANQYLNVTNIGSGTLHWSAHGDASWLTVTTSDSAPETVTLSFNIAGLGAGTYIGVINITDPGATNSPVGVTVTLKVTGGTQQLLGNPGFEIGDTAWIATPDVITNSNGEAAHLGTWKAWLNGWGTTHTDTLRQAVTIPSTATTATLTFWLHIDSAETTTTTQFDRLQVQIRNSAGMTLLATLGTFSNLNRAAGYSLKTFDVTAFKGQTVSVYFLGIEDSSLQTSFVVDDTALNVQY